MRATRTGDRAGSCGGQRTAFAVRALLVCPGEQLGISGALRPCRHDQPVRILSRQEGGEELTLAPAPARSTLVSCSPGAVMRG